MERIYRYRMTTTSGGNLSIREENGDVWITPARVDKGGLRRTDIVLVRADGTVEGEQPPSSELPLHQADLPGAPRRARHRPRASGRARRVQRRPPGAGHASLPSGVAGVRGRRLRPVRGTGERDARRRRRRHLRRRATTASSSRTTASSPRAAISRRRSAASRRSSSPARRSSRRGCSGRRSTT